MIGHATRYPVYIPTKGRHGLTTALTARRLLFDQCPFRLVVEPQERKAYEQLIPALIGVLKEKWPLPAGWTPPPWEILELPFSNLGQGSIPARNWLMEHSIAEGHARHWCMDDNIRMFRRMYAGRRIPVPAGVALGWVEEWSDRYENVAISGLNYEMFVTAAEPEPVRTNVHVYSCILIDNSIPHRWRGRYNEDTDLCLQVLSDGYCTALFNLFTAAKQQTMRMAGGNTDELYKADGRLEMAQSLARAWPGVVEVDRRFERPQHVIVGGWQRFDTPLKRRADVDWDMPQVDERGMTLTATKKVKAESLSEVAETFGQEKEARLKFSCYCLAGATCGWIGPRTAPSKDAAESKPCPRCGSEVKATPL